MEQIYVETTYMAATGTRVKLPEGKTIKDIESVWVKWGEIHILFKDESESVDQEYELSWDQVDTKRPASLEVRPCDGEGEPIYNAEPIIQE